MDIVWLGELVFVRWVGVLSFHATLPNWTLFCVKCF